MRMVEACDNLSILYLGMMYPDDSVPLTDAGFEIHLVITFMKSAHLFSDVKTAVSKSRINQATLKVESHQAYLQDINTGLGRNCAPDLQPRCDSYQSFLRWHTEVCRKRDFKRLLAPLAILPGLPDENNYKIGGSHKSTDQYYHNKKSDKLEGKKTLSATKIPMKLTV